MKIRLPAIILLLVILTASCAVGQGNKWQTIPYSQWGFSLQVPPGTVKKEVGLPESGELNLYSYHGMAFIISVTPADQDLPTSTAIEQAIQIRVKEAPAGTAKRWEMQSGEKQLFKGYTAPTKIESDDIFQVEIGKIVGSGELVECASMAPTGDDSSPILRISVIGPANRQTEIVTSAKGIAGFTKLAELAPAPIANAVTPNQKPGAPAKPWPALKTGEIELTGAVDSISKDKKSLTLTVDLITLPGVDPSILSPARAKKVILRAKQPWITVGQRVRLIGKNEGVGKPIKADAIEPAPH